MRSRFYVILVVLLVACQDVKRPEKPQDLIPQETMVSLLTEVYLGNAARSINNKRIREQGVQLDSFVYARFNIDSLQFVKSNTYYAANLDLYNAIIDSVQKRLETYKEIENKKKLEETEKKKKEDSIKRQAASATKKDTTDEKTLVESVSTEQ